MDMYRVHLALMYIFEAVAIILWILWAIKGYPIQLGLPALAFTQMATTWHIVVYLVYDRSRHRRDI